MSIDLLKELVRSACISGSISNKDMDFLRQRSKVLGIEKKELDRLIVQELKKYQAWENSPTPKPDNAKNSNEVSGINFNENEEKVEEVDDSELFSMQPVFTEVSDFHKQGDISYIQKGKYHDKWVIIKRIKPEKRNDKRYKNLFYREYENAHELDHLHIVKTLGKGVDKQGAYFFMEYVDGRLLSDMIKRDELHPDLIKKIATEILDALDYVHKKQIIHRDLKPDNILVSYQGDNVKIFDFGLAISDKFEESIKQAGTPAYAAPEQIDKHQDIDQRSDIFSFGLILLEMFTGSPDVNNLKKVNKRKYRYIIEKAIEPDKNKRFSSAAEILQVLKKKQLPLKTWPAYFWVLLVFIIFSIGLVLFLRTNQKKEQTNAGIDKIYPGVYNAYEKYDVNLNRLKGQYQGELNGNIRRLHINELQFTESNKIFLRYTIQGLGKNHKLQAGQLYIENNEIFIYLQSLGRGNLKVEDDNYILTSTSPEYNWHFELQKY